MTLRGPVPAADISSAATFDPGSAAPPSSLSTSNGYPSFASASTQLGPLIDDLLAHGRQGFNTLNGIASTWAPAGRDPGDYATNLALRAGLKPTQPLDVGHPATLAKLTNAVIWNQLGHNPFGASQINQAVQDRLDQRQALLTRQDRAAKPAPAASVPAGEPPVATPPDAIAPYSIAGQGAKQERQLPTESLDGTLASKSTSHSIVSNDQRAIAAGKAAPGQADSDWNHLGAMTLTASQRGGGGLIGLPGDIARALTHTSPEAAAIYARLGPGARKRAMATDNMPVVAALTRALPTSDEATAGIVKAMGNTPYNATSAGGRIFQQAVSGGVSAGPFGVPGMLYGALSGMASQGAQELKLPPWLQTAAGIGIPLLAGHLAPVVREAGSLAAPLVKSTLEDFAADESGGVPRGPKPPAGTGGAGMGIVDRGLFGGTRKAYWKGEAEISPDSQSQSPEALARMKLGKPPIGDDGYPMELHHMDGTPDGGITPMTRTQHRLGENFLKNHPWLRK
jgi:hypothetical protein